MFRVASVVFLISAILFSACRSGVSTTDLRLTAKNEGGREWLEITAPPQALKINDWIKNCSANVEVLYQSPRVLSLACRSKPQSYASFQLEDGQRLGLMNVIQAGGEGQLQEAVNRYLRKQHLHAFRPNDNFALTAQGLMFPTAEGDVVVSSIELRPLLRPDAALLVGR